MLVFLALMAPLLLLITRPWAPRLLQIALFVISAEWIRTIISLMQERLASGEPYGRMMMILGGVALFTLGSACIFFLPAMKKRYNL